MEKFTVDYFINKFSAIPEELWCTNLFSDGEKRCALGHCGQDLDTDTREGGALFNMIFHATNLGPEEINDGIGFGGERHPYQQPTPKQRILAALHDIKKMQEPQPEETFLPELPPVPMTFIKKADMKEELIYAN
jgi:hypothetical protein